jgi:TPR repeat protein
MAFQETQTRAESGDAVAQTKLARMYEHGTGVAQNYTEAVKWYEKAAGHGMASAQFNLGLCYFNGHGVPQNCAEGLKWYRKAAEQGVAMAQYNLGLRYGFGMNVPRDPVEACKWFNLAAAQNATATVRKGDEISDPKPSSFYVSFAIDRRNELVQSMTPAQVAESQRLAGELLAHKAGDPPKPAEVHKLASVSRSNLQ